MKKIEISVMCQGIQWIAGSSSSAPMDLGTACHMTRYECGSDREYPHLSDQAQNSFKGFRCSNKEIVILCIFICRGYPRLPKSNSTSVDSLDSWKCSHGILIITNREAYTNTINTCGKRDNHRTPGCKMDQKKKKKRENPGFEKKKKVMRILPENTRNTATPSQCKSPITTSNAADINLNGTFYCSLPLFLFTSRIFSMKLM